MSCGSLLLCIFHAHRNHTIAVVDGVSACDALAPRHKMRLYHGSVGKGLPDLVRCSVLAVITES